MPSLTIDPALDLPVIPGQPPDLENLPPGCAFASRCNYTVEECRVSRPALRAINASHARACHFEPADLHEHTGTTPA
jgi:oligopeptide/dipeptide ABC transporter ATP-binding protein